MIARLALIALLVLAPILHAQDDSDRVPLPVNPPAPSGGSPVLVVTSWNVKHLGRGEDRRRKKDGGVTQAFDATQSSPMLADADIVVFQEVNKSASGLKALRKIADQLKFYMPNETFCMGLSEVPSDAIERFAYLWKQSRIAYVKTDGTVLDTCDPASAITIRVARRFAADIVREPPLGSFFFRPLARPFVLAGVHLVPTKKRPAAEVEPLFNTFATTLDQPVIVAGDYNLDSKDPAFRAASSQLFRPSMLERRTSLSNESRTLANAYDNFWYRGLKLQARSTENPRVIDLYAAFPEKGPGEIYDTFSDHCPITAWFEFPEKN